MMQATRTSKKAIYLDLRRGRNVILKAGLKLGCGFQIRVSQMVLCALDDDFYQKLYVDICMS